MTPLEHTTALEALASLRERLAARQPAVAAGVVEGADALLIAALHDGPATLVVTSGAREAERLAADLEALAAAPVAYFPPSASTNRKGTREVDQRAHAQRLAVLDRLGAARPTIVVAPLTAVWQRTHPPSRLRAMTVALHAGLELPPEDLVARLDASGYQAVKQVTYRGEFARRGGIVDVFGHGAASPLRIEYFGDEVDSLRAFDPGTQVATHQIDAARISLAAPETRLTTDEARATVLDYLPGGALRIVLEPHRITELLGGSSTAVTPGYSSERADEVRAGLDAGPRVDVVAFGVPGAVDLRSRTLTTLGGDLAGALAGVGALAERCDTLTIFCDNSAQRERLARLAEEYGVGSDVLSLHTGRLAAGFELPDARLICLPYHQLFGQQAPRRLPTKIGARADAAAAACRPERTAAISEFLSLAPGDYVVHQVHGVGRFKGVTGEGDEEFLAIDYAGGVELCVPVTQAEQVQRYVGSRGHAPRLDTIGGNSWTNRKRRVASALEGMADDLLELQALRATKRKRPFPPDDELQLEFEAAFVHDETTCQQAAIAEVKTDMESERPMDRLLCGDVGYGKTEVALRAAFKAVCDSRQVAVLVPTTILAQQHLQTFRERLTGFAVRVEALSRLRSPSEQRTAIEDARAGKVDILIGTHRLLSRDVRFRELGLVIVDEEQRFGVKHKQTLRKLRSVVDVLSLSATPIPRTLHFALVGARDISLLTTPPRERRAIETRITTASLELFREAALRELRREGQILFVHNRVRTIGQTAGELADAVPEARFGIGHGQMAEGELERVMTAFVDGDIDVLVATTIVENGLDLPRAGTIFIDRADRFGLAELHQLRGRVGRNARQAHAYFLVPASVSSAAARRRLRAIEEHSQLGGGFELAMADLEIRGAGNLLGKEQSGHIATVGYATYCRLLARAVAKLTGEAETARPETLTSVDLGVGAHLPKDYVEDDDIRLELYGRLSRVADLAEVETLRRELRDRFGPLPTAAERLVRVSGLRVRAAASGIRLLKQTAGRLVVSGELARLVPPEDYPLPIRIVEADTALVVLPPIADAEMVLDALDALFGAPVGQLTPGGT